MDIFPQIICAALRDIGVHASVIQPHGRGVEIAEGPIREVDSIDGCAAGCCGGFVSLSVPDERIKHRPVFYVRSVRVRSIPLVGPVRDIHWELGAIRLIDQPVDWTDRKIEFGKYVADFLTRSTHVRDQMIHVGTDVGVGLDTEEGAWSIFPEDETEDFNLRRLFTRRRYEFYQSLARTLLLMPLPEPGPSER